MRSASIAIALGTTLGLATPCAFSTGFGRVATSTLLGQPLAFGALVQLEGDETLTRECVSAEVDAGERRLPSGLVRVSVESGPRANERWVRVTTSVPIDEPVVAVQVTLACGVSVSRRFVSFIDPPEIALAQAAPADAPAMPAQRLDTAVAPVVAVAQPASEPVAEQRPMPRAQAPREPRRPRTAARRDLAPLAPAAAPIVAAAPPPRPAKPLRPRVVAAAAAVVAAADAGARLKLEAAAALLPSAAASTSAPLSAPQPPAPAASSPEPVLSDAALAAELARLKSLEDDVKRVREQTLASQRQVATLQARLKEAEEARYANPLVYVLASLSALLAVALAALWWRRSQVRGASPWWSPAGEAARAPRPRPAPAPEPPPPVYREEPAARSTKVETVPAVMDERPIPTVTEDVVPPRMVFPPEPAPAQVFPATVFPHTMPPDAARRELAVEELIDLEQQAEFFIVLGQEDAAIDLLMGHLRSTGGASPLPYLKLLEIYRRRGERDAYERIRSRFNRRFNAYAPDWDADLQQGRSLEDHPQLLTRIQSSWNQPGQVMEMLDAALLQRDELAEPFDLPACRELLFLYSIARDRAENEGKLPTIDLLLPIETAAAAAAAPTSGHVPLDLDVSSPIGLDSGESRILGLADGRPRRA